MSKNKTDNDGITFTAWDENDEEVEHTLPAKWDICDRCRGNGKHVNPNIDGHGISMEEWNGPDWDDESREMYMNGGYDVACEEKCENGKVLVVDEDRADPKILELYHEFLDEQWRARKERESERRWGY